MSDRLRNSPMAILAPLVLLLCSLVWIALDYEAETEAQTRLQQRQQLELAAQQMANLLHQVDISLFQLTEQPPSREDRPELLRQQLDLVLVGLDADLGAVLLSYDQNGNILASAPEGRLSRGDIPLHLLSQPGSPIAGPTLIHATNDNFLLLTHHLGGANGLTLAALLPVQEMFAHIIREPQLRSCKFGLFNATNRLIYPRNQSGTRVLEETLQQALQTQQSGWLRYNPTATATGIAFTPLQVPGARWTLTLTVPRPTGIALPTSFWFTLAAGILLSSLALRRWRQATQKAVSAAPLEETESLRQELHLARLRWHHFLQYAAEALFQLDPETGRIIQYSQQISRLLGYNRDELRGLSFEEIVPPDQQRRLQRLIGRLQRDQTAEDYGLLLRHKSGRLLPVAIHIRNGQYGHTKLIHGMLHDISAELMIEQELRQSNRNLRLLNRIAHAAAGSANLTTQLDQALQEVATTLGAAGGGIYLLRHEGRVLHLSAADRINSELREVLEQLPHDKGLVGRVCATGRPQSSANLQRDQRLWAKQVLDHAWAGFQAVPLVSAEKTVGALFLFCNDRRVFSRTEVELLRAIGHQLGTAVTGAELVEALRWQNRLTDVSNRELQRSREQLQLNLDKQERVNLTLARMEEMKNRFLALASHELRTPLTYVLSASEMLSDQLESSVTPQNKRLLTMIHQGGKRLQEIVDDLIEIARLEAQDFYLGRQRIVLPVLVETLQRNAHSKIESRQLAFSTQIPNDLPDLLGDPDHLLRALERLLENAIKFTPAGGHITLSVVRRGATELLACRSHLEPYAPEFFASQLQPDYLQLTLTDTGIGIAAEDQLNIFDKFQATGDINEHFSSRLAFGGKGVGLGLTLAKGMIEAHGGMVWVESEGIPDKGSQFHLLLPIPQGQTVPAALAESA